MASHINRLLSDEGPMLETLDYTIRIDSTPTFLYFDLYLFSAYAAHYVYFILIGDIPDAARASFFEETGGLRSKSTYSLNKQRKIHFYWSWFACTDRATLVYFE